jgi:hypothetical protein
MMRASIGLVTEPSQEAAERPPALRRAAPQKRYALPALDERTVAAAEWSHHGAGPGAFRSQLQTSARPLSP